MTTAPTPESRRHGPAIPRWMLPSVRVRRRGDVITVEQRVPARVESIQTRSSYDSAHRGYVEHHDIPTFESGLRSPTGLALVKERLTIPASAASEQQVRQAVDHTVAAYDPGTAALSVQLSGGMLLRLLQTVAALGMAGIGLYLAISSYRSPSIAPAGDPFAGFQKVLTALPSVFALVALAIAVTCARATWVLRTPRFVAEEQWGLLRQTLTQLAGQEPGSSRPLDIEAGLRRDLITHPNGGPLTRGVTRDGRMGPPWPDAYDVAKRIRQGRRALVGMTIFASVFLLVGIVIFLLSIAAGQLTLIPLLFGVSIFGAIVSHISKRCDRLLVSYPSTMPGGEEPQELSWADIDTASLPAWCDARRRERYWNLVAIVFLVEFVVAVLAIFASVMMNQTAFSAGSSSQEAHAHALIWNSVLAVVVIAAALATVAIGRHWIHKKDSELRHQAGLL
ncbi:hypothetical protein [Actinomyces oris]|uniref:DUF2868 domain-containing protein n=1 Tax=Actinomyces oris TaxID=544580 RepID=A0AAW8L5J0_9ACTO|nr:hypothetical protein [Actinomyces oris]MDR0176809.1 hypothetical protein [Actinomyces oris]